MKTSYIVSLVAISFIPGLVHGQVIDGERPAISDPTTPSPKMEATMSQIRELDELRAENERLKARLQELESRLDEIAQVELTGVIFGADKSAAALLKIGGQLQLVRPGDVLTPPGGKNGAAAQTIHVSEILVDSVHLKIGESEQAVVVR